MKKYIVTTVMILCSVVLIMGIFYGNSKRTNANYAIMEYKTFLFEETTQIRLRTAIDSKICVSFSDKELIKKWINYFESANFTYIKEINNSAQNGGLKTVDFLNTEKIFSFQFFEDDEPYIIIDNMLFSVKSNTNFPFAETYKLATEMNYTIDLTN